MEEIMQTILKRTRFGLIQSTSLRMNGEVKLLFEVGLEGSHPTVMDCSGEVWGGW